MRWLSVWILCGVISVGCGDDSAPPPGGDTGTRDGGVDGGGDPVDGGDEDAGDAAGVDAPMIDVGPVDAPMIDATDSGTDGGFDPETCFDSEGVYDLCLCDTPECSPAAPETCGAGTTCLPDGCDRNTCQLAGAECESDDDCHPSSSCARFAFVPVCDSGAATCNDSRDCPRGHSCDAGSCVNRRIGCTAGPDCPWGFYCDDTDTFVDEPYCRRLYQPCNAFEVCGPGFSCIDIDGDGDNECRPNSGGDCDSSDDCAPGTVCGADPSKNTDCRSQGPCASGADCAAGFTCVDPWGDGVSICVTAGSCTTSADCPAGSVCGTTSETAPLSCIPS